MSEDDQNSRFRAVYAVGLAIGGTAGRVCCPFYEWEGQQERAGCYRTVWRRFVS